MSEITIDTISASPTVTEDIRQARQEVLDRHYQAARTELTMRVKQEPLKQQFTLDAGCPTDEIAQYVADKFTSEGIPTTVAKFSWWVVSGRNLKVEVPLGSLVPTSANAPACVMSEVAVVEPVDHDQLALNNTTLGEVVEIIPSTTL
jgi:hypothetical protein